MDSNFQVKITADISDLTSRLKAVEVELQKFSKSVDKAGDATKNMEQNANRGRLTAFAFGQVLRDSGFFAQSFSLGILAISNNVPILIDQIALSVKALQPFAGAISIASSVLTAALTIWAYSSQAVNKNTESIEDYMNKLDDLRQTQINASSSAKSEIIDLENLRRASQNQALSVRDRKKAIDELRDRWPDYYKGLSDETIMAGKDAEAHRKLANAILAVAKVQANKDKIVLNSKKIDILYQNQQDKRLEQEKFLSTELLKVRKGLSEQGITDPRVVNNEMAAAKMRIKMTEGYLKFTKEINDIEVRRGELLYSNIQLSEDMQKLIATTGTVSITGDFGKPAEEAKDIWKDFSNTLKAINLDPTTSEFQKLNKAIDAHRSMLGELSKETYKGVDEDIKTVTESMSGMQSQVDELAKTSQVNDLLSQFNLRLKDINGNATATADTIKGQTIEAIDDLINKLQQVGGLDALVLKLSNLKNSLASDFAGIDALIQARLESLKQSFISWKVSLDEQVTNFVANTVSDFLYGLGQMAAGADMTGRDLGNTLLQGMAGFLKQLGEQMVQFGALALAFGKLQLAMIFGDPFTKIGAAIALIAVGAALSLAAGAIGQSASKGLSGSNAPMPPTQQQNQQFSIPTSFQTGSMAIVGQNRGVLETRVSGNDLVILMDKASNNRNRYF